MSLGDLRQFIGSLAGLPDEAEVKAKVTLRKHLRSVTVEEDDGGFRDFVRAVEHGDDERTEARKVGRRRQSRGELGRAEPSGSRAGRPRRNPRSPAVRGGLLVPVPAVDAGGSPPSGRWGMLRGCRGRVTGGRWVSVRCGARPGSRSWWRRRRRA